MARVCKVGSEMGLSDHNISRVVELTDNRSGDLVSFSVFGQEIVIINSFEMAQEMLLKKGSIYSSRPDIPMANLIGWNEATVLTPYNDKVRQFRRSYHHGIGTRAAVENLYSLEEEEAYTMMKNIMGDPENFSRHIRRSNQWLLYTSLRALLTWRVNRSAASKSLKVIYGYRIPNDSDLYELSDITNETFGASTSPQLFPVNFFPARK